MATLAVLGTVEAPGDRCHPPPAGAFASVPQRSWGFVALGPMTTRSNRPVPAAVVYGASGGAGTTTVVVPLVVLTQPGHVGGHRVLVDFGSGAFDVLGRPPYKPPAQTGAHRSPVGADCGRS